MLSPSRSMSRLAVSGGTRIELPGSSATGATTKPAYLKPKTFAIVGNVVALPFDEPAGCVRGHQDRAARVIRHGRDHKAGVPEAEDFRHRRKCCRHPVG